MYSAIAANKRKTWLILVGFLALVYGLAYLFGLYYGGDYSFTMVALVIAAVYALISYYGASKLALALNGGHLIAKRDEPRLWRTVENLAITEGLPMPKVAIIDDPAPNAFATGRNPEHSLIGATTGLLAVMDDKELEGVMAHEMGHIKNYDIRVSLMAAALVMAIGLLADMFWRMQWFGDRDRNSSGAIAAFALVAAILAPLIATLLRLAISRHREYLADASGVLTTRYPEGLASALAKIAEHGSQLKRQHTSTSHFFIANPLSGGLAGLFSTHPPVDERIRRLHEMGGQL